MRNMIYADNAATTKLDTAAFEAMTPWLLDEYGNASQSYTFARKPKKAIAEARATIAACIGAEPDEIFFTSGGTESDNWVIKGSAFTDTEKRVTITSAFEHHAVLNSCASIEQMKYPVAYMPSSTDGYITPDILQEYITDRSRLVSVMYANNEIGTIQPICDLCELAHVHGALFHTDAVQALGHVKINVHELGVDYLSASAHKFNGPKGIGFLYVHKGIDLPPYMSGGRQENMRRAGTENVASIVGMSIALKENCDAIERNRQYLMNLEDRLISKLNDFGIHYRKNGGNQKLPGLLSLSFPDKEGEVILHRMDLMGICISTGSACDSLRTEISHVLRAIRLDDEYAKGTVRISLGKDNTNDEVDAIADSLARILL